MRALMVGFATLAAVIGLVALSLAFRGVDAPQGKTQEATEQSQISTAPISQPKSTSDRRPDDSGHLVHPYDLTKNPFNDKAKMVRLDPLSFPIMFQGTLETYRSIDPGMAKQVGMKGLRFDRMFSEELAVYDVMVLEAGGSGTTMVGQIAVGLNLGDQPPDDTRIWDAEPLGLLDGTNLMGARISLPLVKFWGYNGSEAVMVPSPPQAGLESEAAETEPIGDALTAIKLVSEKLKPTADLTKLQPYLKGMRWSATKNSAPCADGFWYVEGRLDTFQDLQNPVQITADWCVRIDNEIIRPSTAAVKYFELSGGPV